MSWRIPPAGSLALSLSEGDQLRITDPVGGQPCDLNAFVLPDFAERFSAGRTRTMEGIHPGVGAALWSGPPHDRRLFTISSDSVGANDVLFPRCSRLRYEEVGIQEHPNCQDLLTAAIVPYGLSAIDVHDSFNIFMRTALDDGGRPRIVDSDGLSPGMIELVAHFPSLVALSACPNGTKYGRENSHLIVAINHGA
jgi:uncharacterized protein